MTEQRSVLLIEDDPWFAEQLGRILKAAGYSPLYASDGIAGIDALDTATPDVVVLDVFLPGPNAFVLLHEMQSYTDLSKIPIILCTASAIDVPLEKVSPYGVVAVLDKETMHPSDVVAAVRRALA